MRVALTARILVAIAGSGLGSCSAMVAVDQPSNGDPANYSNVVTLSFVTNRRLDVDADGARRYGNELGELSAGRCVVAFGDDDWRGDLIEVDTAPLDATLPSPESGPIVLYVHGYSESFSKSCRRAALLQERLGLDGRLLLFSWPSRNYLTYEQDADELAASIDRLNELISLAVDRIGQDNILIMSHSMGTRGVVEALSRRVEGPARFRGIVMIAPDISRKDFLQNVAMLRAQASSITVYMSDNDRAMWLSTTVNASGRLGNAAEIPVEGEDLNLVDITPTGTNHISGHLYHLHNPAVIEDLRFVIGTAAPGADRRWRREPTGAKGIWKLSGDAD